MRRGTIVAGVTAGVLGAAGVGTAAAATAPITVTFGTGTVTAGTLPQATAATTGTPATLAGAIDLTTFAASFPAESVKLPDATLESVDFGPGFGSGKLVIHPNPGAFSGAINLTTASFDLRGTVSYTLIASTALGTRRCLSEGAAPLTLAGKTLDLVSGSYAVAGSQANVLLRAETLTDLESVAFCTSQAQKLLPGAPVASAFSGSVAIPGLVPLPKPAASTPTTPTVPATPSAPTAPSAPQAPAAKPGRLRLTVARPATVARGRSTVTKVVVTNVGAGTARGVTVRVAAPGRGVTPRATTKTYASIAPGRSRTIALRLRTTRSAARSSKVTATATGTGGLTASRSVTLKLR